jgi:hypothetical protein
VELSLNPNFVEMLRELSATGAEFLIVGGHAVGVHEDAAWVKQVYRGI